MGWKAMYNLDDMTRSHWKWEKTYRDGLKPKEQNLSEQEKLI